MNAAKQNLLALTKKLDHLNKAGHIAMLLEHEQIKKCSLQADGGDGVDITQSNPAEYNVYRAENLIFTGRINVYIDNYISEKEFESLYRKAENNGLKLVIKDKRYAEEVTKSETPFAFISHDSRDKEQFVKPLVKALSSFPSFPIWYDEYSLDVGDSLRDSIDNGLKTAKRCVVVLSPNFFDNSGWGKAEFDAIFTREIVQEKNVILPIWHNVSRQEVYEFCPRMADKVGLNSSEGAEEIARKLYLKINRDT